MISPAQRLEIYDHMVLEGEDPEDPSFDLKLLTVIVDRCKLSEGVDECGACNHFFYCGLRKSLKELREASNSQGIKDNKLI